MIYGLLGVHDVSSVRLDMIYKGKNPLFHRCF